MTARPWSTDAYTRARGPQAKAVVKGPLTHSAMLPPRNRYWFVAASSVQPPLVSAIEVAQPCRSIRCKGLGMARPAHFEGQLALWQCPFA